MAENENDNLGSPEEVGGIEQETYSPEEREMLVDELYRKVTQYADAEKKLAEDPLSASAAYKIKEVSDWFARNRRAGAKWMVDAGDEVMQALRVRIGSNAEQLAAIETIGEEVTQAPEVQAPVEVEPKSAHTPERTTLTFEEAASLSTDRLIVKVNEGDSHQDRPTLTTQFWRVIKQDEPVLEQVILDRPITDPQRLEETFTKYFVSTLENFPQEPEEIKEINDYLLTASTYQEDLALRDTRSFPYGSFVRGEMVPGTTDDEKNLQKKAADSVFELKARLRPVLEQRLREIAATRTSDTDPHDAATESEIEDFAINATMDLFDRHLEAIRRFSQPDYQSHYLEKKKTEQAAKAAEEALFVKMDWKSVMDSLAQKRKAIVDGLRAAKDQAKSLIKEIVTPVDAQTIAMGHSLDISAGIRMTDEEKAKHQEKIAQQDEVEATKQANKEFAKSEHLAKKQSARAARKEQAMRAETQRKIFEVAVKELSPQLLAQITQELSSIYDTYHQPASWDKMPAKLQKQYKQGLEKAFDWDYQKAVVEAYLTKQSGQKEGAEAFGANMSERAGYLLGDQKKYSWERSKKISSLREDLARLDKDAEKLGTGEDTEEIRARIRELEQTIETGRESVETARSEVARLEAEIDTLEADRFDPGIKLVELLRVLKNISVEELSSWDSFERKLNPLLSDEVVSLAELHNLFDEITEVRTRLQTNTREQILEGASGGGLLSGNVLNNLRGRLNRDRGLDPRGYIQLDGGHFDAMLYDLVLKGALKRWWRASVEPAVQGQATAKDQEIQAKRNRIDEITATGILDVADMQNADLAQAQEELGAKLTSERVSFDQQRQELVNQIDQLENSDADMESQFGVENPIANADLALWNSHLYNLRKRLGAERDAYLVRITRIRDDEVVVADKLKSLIPENFPEIKKIWLRDRANMGKSIKTIEQYEKWLENYNVGLVEPPEKMLTKFKEATERLAEIESARSDWTKDASQVWKRELVRVFGLAGLEPDKIADIESLIDGGASETTSKYWADAIGKLKDYNEVQTDSVSVDKRLVLATTALETIRLFHENVVTLDDLSREDLRKIWVEMGGKRLDRLETQQKILVAGFAALTLAAGAAGGFATGVAIRPAVEEGINRAIPAVTRMVEKAKDTEKSLLELFNLGEDDQETVSAQKPESEIAPLEPLVQVPAAVEQTPEKVMDIEAGWKEWERQLDILKTIDSPEQQLELIDGPVMALVKHMESQYNQLSAGDQAIVINDLFGGDLRNDLLKTGLNGEPSRLRQDINTLHKRAEIFIQRERGEDRNRGAA